MGKTIALRIPEVGFIASTRVALGVGLGLLLSNKLNNSQRKGSGWALLAIGALTTVPLIVNLVRKTKQPGVIGT